MFSRCLNALLPLVILATGCAAWQKPEKRFRLPSPQVPLDAIPCEIAFLQWDPRQVEKDQQFWLSVDEQFLSAEVRQRLQDNGLRIGLISGTLPSELRDKLEATRDPVAALTAEKMPPGTEMLSRRERLQCRLGIADLIEVLPESARRGAILWSEEGRVVGKVFDRPRGFFTLTTHSHGDGRLRLELIPGIDHGEPRQRMIGNPAMMRIEVRRDQKLFELLAVDALVRPGQTLIVTSTPAPKGIGATFFSSRFATGSDQLFLLIRVGSSQRDNLFITADQVEPLVTPIE
jgi:hypothetical protein